MQFIKRPVVFLFVLLGIVLDSASQNAPTYIDWARPNQTYLEIKVGKEGVYRLTTDILQSHFPNLENLNATGFQLFRRGVEQAILVSAGADNIINGSDFIDFVGKPNDASIELEMYLKPVKVYNKYKSLYDDTAHYFITHNPSLNGLRVVNNGLINNTSVAFENYHLRSAINFKFSTYNLGAGFRTNATFSSYINDAECWVGTGISAGFGNDRGSFNSPSYFLVDGIQNLYTQGPKPILEMMHVGRRFKKHPFSIYINSNVSLLSDTSLFSDYNAHLFSAPFEANLVEGNKLNIWTYARNEANLAQAYAKVIYPATFQMPNGFSQLSFELVANPNNYSRLKFENISSAPELYDVTDPLKPIKIGVGFVNGAFIAGVENTATAKNLIIQNQPIVPGQKLLKTCAFTNFSPASFDYILVSHPSLRKPVLGYQDPVTAYADFRKSTDGGSYKVLTLMMDEVYERFGYGDRTPLALRNLGGYFIQNQVKPKAMFLLGKGLKVSFRFNPNYAKQNLIPTFGVPASDHAYSFGLGEPGKTTAFPVGRLAATSPEQIANYLNKVKEVEAFQYDDLWKKNVFHISGGNSAAEQSSFTYLMSVNLKNRVIGPYYGAKVGLYNKNTNAIVQPIDVRKILNNGISLLTLFGHSSQEAADVDIGLVSNPSLGVNNTGKYPVVVVNGCFPGDIYRFDGSLNEDWIFTPGKGAVAFIGASDEGFSGLLWKHMEIFYQKAFQDSTLFGSTIGKIQQETFREYLVNLSTQPQLDSAFIQQFALHGDPALRIFGAKLPDYKTSNAEVYIATPGANASSPSLKIGVIASNFGRYNGDSLLVGIRRRFGDGQNATYLFKVRPLAYKDTFFLTLPQNETFTYAGTNRIEVVLDFLNEVNEMRETNNSGTIEYFLPTSGIIPLFPKNYSIVSNRNVRMTVQTSNLLAGSRRFIFQMDTSANFNSPLFLQSLPITSGNICNWNPLLPLDKDSLVFFWRVKFADLLSPNDTAWYTSSFEYIKNSPTGWAQSHFYQFSKSEDVGVEKDYFFRKWNFPIVNRNLEIKVSGGSKKSPKIYNCTLDGISILENTIVSSDCFKEGYPRIGAIHIDRCSLIPSFWNYTNDPGGYFSAGCGRLPFLVNIFTYDPSYNTLKAYFKRYMEQEVKVGDYVLLFSLDSLGKMDSVRKYMAPHMPLIGLNGDSLGKIQNGNPFIIFGQKLENPSNTGANLVIAKNPSGPINRETIEFKKILTSSCSYGSITSTKIGPASKWHKLFNKMGNLESPMKDEFNLQLIGVNLNGKDTVLVPTINQFPFDLEFVNPDSFPFLQVRAFVKDTTYFTPATIKRWMVTYEGVPEGVINTNLIPLAEYQPKILQEGDSVGYRFAFTNISQKAFKDSVKVHFNLNGSLYSVKNLGLLPADSTVNFKFDKIGTLGRQESNSLLAFVNPRLQPEEYYENNALILPFKVIQDKVQPVLDVTFDGVKIMNGDFVSPKPLISISLKDENKFLLKGDTSGMSLLLTPPCSGCLPERIPLNSPLVKIYPAGKDNMFRLEYRPEKLENGNYRLAVQGSDVKGNESGSQSYQVDFKVLDQNSISNFYPYPNPFSTSCQWVFTLTGNIPEDFKVQIMTVTGKVVREITKAELGPLRIGNNISSYRWNATDEFGDRLANGVYLYRVVMKESGAYIHRSTEGDFTFTKGFGKLYIIR